MRLLAVNKLLVCLTLICFMHRVFFSEGFLQYVPFVILLASLILNLLIFINKFGRLNPLNSSLIIIIMSLIVVSINLIIGVSYLFIIIGYATTFMFCIYWFLVFNNIKIIKDEKFEISINKLIIINCLIIAGVGYYQYFMDFSLFGLNKHVHYGDHYYIYYEIYSKRITSTVGSPQNCSLILFIGFIVGVYKIKNVIYKTLYLGNILGVGILTGSGSFLGCILISFAVLKFTNRYIILQYLIRGLIVFIALILFFEVFDLKEYDVINSSVNLNPTSHLQFYIQILESKNVAYGNGLGVCDRLVGKYLAINQLDNWQPISESHLIRLYKEMGLFCLIIMGAVIINIMKFKNVNNMRYSIIINVGMIFNLIFTPVIGGFTGSMFFWYFCSRNNDTYNYGK